MKMRTDTRLGHPEKILFVLILVFKLSIFSFAATVPDSIIKIISPPQKLKLLERISQGEKNGQPEKTDSLYAVLDTYKALNREDLLRWARLKAALNRYSAGAELLARVAGVAPHYVNAVYVQLNQLLESAPADSMAPAAGTFQKRVLRLSGIDTVGVQLWLADFYARHGMDGAELDALAAGAGVSARLVPRLLAIARRRYADGRYAAAVRAGTLVYEHAAGARQKADAVELLYRSYRALHRNDSALVWIEKSNLSNEDRRTEAAALYQCAGRLSDAKAMIEKLPASFSRDTLELRQCLWNGDTRGARERAKKNGREWAQHPNETLLWNVRALLFDGAFDDLAALFDTVHAAASWEGAQEILGYRFRLQLLQRSKEALSAWSRIEYDLFTDRPDRAVRRLSDQAVPPDGKRALLVSIIRTMLVRGDTGAVMPLFQEQGEAADSPEYLYLYAETLLRAGGSEQAERLLLRIIKDYSGDVFSEKARVLLAKIKSKSKE
jgi:hypothetical protein